MRSHDNIKSGAILSFDVVCYGFTDQKSKQTSARSFKFDRDHGKKVGRLPIPADILVDIQSLI